MKFNSTLSAEHSRKEIKKKNEITSEIYYSFISFEYLGTTRFLSSLMHFLNMTCPVLIF